MKGNALIRTTTALGAMLTLACAQPALAQTAPYTPDPTVMEVTTGSEISIARLPDGVYLRDVNDPDDIIWDRIPAYRIGLLAAPPMHPSTQLRYDPQKNGHVYFQLARTSDRFYVRMRWPDTTQNRAETVNTFSDGAAIQFALNGEDTNFMMGTGPDKPVNIWYWKASRHDIQNLAAGGFGSTTTLPDQVVTGKATYHADEPGQNQYWHLVMSRELDVSGDHQIDLRSGVVPLSFALWQGEDGQRDGNKVINMGWVLVNVDPDADDTQ